MLEQLRKHWEAFKASPPGRRFQDVHKQRAERAAASGGHGGGLRRWLMLGGGIVLTAAGVIFLPAPGPGSVVLLAGIAMVASESLLMARFLDKMELVFRPRVLRAHRWWRHAGSAQRFTILGIAAVCGVLAAGTFYRYVIH